MSNQKNRNKLFTALAVFALARVVAVRYFLNITPTIIWK
jgi:hypothetical protein